MTLTSEQADDVFTILMCAGARESERSDFIYYLTDPTVRHHEYRFQGSLGFGGKYYYPENRISFYSEDTNPERDKLRDVLNAVLVAIAKGWDRK